MPDQENTEVDPADAAEPPVSDKQNGDPMSEINKALEADSIYRASAAENQDERLKWIQIANALQDRRKAREEIRGAHLAAINAEAELRHQRSRFVATTVVPLLTVFMALKALLTQSHLSNVANVDGKWQEAMKAVSFKDSKSALTGALSM
jgi:hypothetical protein